jgi:hypothetical protein
MIELNVKEYFLVGTQNACGEGWTAFQASSKFNGHSHSRYRGLREFSFLGPL